MENEINIVEQIPSFGKDGAELEAETYLAQYFVETDVYRQAASGMKTVIIGRKGSGKSAIFRFLKYKEKTDNIRRDFIEPDDISLTGIQSYLNGDYADQIIKNLVWKRLFLVSIAQFILDIARTKWDNEKVWPNEIKKIREFLVENGEATDLNATEKFKAFMSQAQPEKLTIKLSAIEIGTENKREDKPEDSHKIIEQLEKFLLSIIKTDGFSDKKFNIYVDRVDDLWKNDEASNHLVIGLLLAAYEINTHFDFIRCIVFLRADIYQILNFHNKDHLHSEELEIEWNNQGLSDLLFKRVLKYVQVNREEFGNQIFGGQVEGVAPLDYIISRTLMRPRDLIQFSNKCLESAKLNKNSQILSSDILWGETPYSKWKLGDLVREYTTNYPFLNSLLIAFGKQLGFTTPKFKRQDFENKYNKILSKLEQQQTFLKGITTDIILAILYNVNFLGTIRQSVSVYHYGDPNTINELDDTFIIHQAFWKALGISNNEKEKTKISAESQDNVENSKIKPLPPKTTSQQPSTAKPETKSSQKETSHMLAGSDEVVSPSYKSTFGQRYAEYEATITKIEQMGMPTKDKVKLTRLISYVYQTKSILGEIVRLIEASFDKDKYPYQFTEMIQQMKILERRGESGRYFPGVEIINRFNNMRNDLQKACALIEVSISELEDIAEAPNQDHWFRREAREAGEELNAFLLKFYKTLITDYDFDMTKMRSKEPSNQ